jgi:hypothetical protein
MHEQLSGENSLCSARACDVHEGVAMPSGQPMPWTSMTAKPRSDGAPGRPVWLAVRALGPGGLRNSTFTCRNTDLQHSR